MGQQCTPMEGFPGVDQVFAFFQEMTSCGTGVPCPQGVATSMCDCLQSPFDSTNEVFLPAGDHTHPVAIQQRSMGDDDGNDVLTIISEWTTDAHIPMSRFELPCHPHAQNLRAGSNQLPAVPALPFMA